MNTLTVPISFMNIEVMNKWYKVFEDESFKICKKYHVEELWDNAVILKDDKKNELALVSLGAYSLGSNTEKAVNEIVEKFESMFGDSTFLDKRPV